MSYVIKKDKEVIIIIIIIIVIIYFQFLTILHRVFTQNLGWLKAVIICILCIDICTLCL